MEASFVDDVCSTLETALSIVRSASDTSAPAPSRDRVAAVAEGLKSESAKVGYMFSQKDLPGKIAAESLLAGLRDTAATLCMLFAAAASGRGPTLGKSLDVAASSVIEPVIALVKAAGTAGGPSSAPTLHKLAGLCMERCDTAAKAPLDDRTAIGRALTLVAKQLADAASELAEEEATAAGGCGEKDEANEAEKEDEDEDANRDELIVVMRGARRVIEAAGGVLKTTMRALLTVDASLGEERETWESVLFHARGLGAAADDLAIASYTPDEKEDVRGAAEALATGCELVADEVPGGGVVAAAEEVERAAQELIASLDSD